MKQNLKIFLIFLGLLSLGILSEPSMENDSKEGLSDNEEKEIYDMLRLSSKTLSQNWILSCYSNRACIQMALSHHYTA